jgi:CheY-like chemotaxis protein
MTILTLLVHSKRRLRKQIELEATRLPLMLMHIMIPLWLFQNLNLDFYDLLLIDIDMPKMNGFDFCVKPQETQP